MTARPTPIKLMDQKFTREDTMHAWYDEPGGLHPFDRTTVPTRKNTVDMDGKYSWSTAVRHAEDGRLEAGAACRDRWSPAASMANLGSTTIRWSSTCSRSMGGASVMLRHFARMHERRETLPPGRAMPSRIRLNDPGTSSRPKGTGAAGGRPRRSAARCATGSKFKAARSRTIRSSRRPHGMSARGRRTACAARWRKR